MKRLLLPLMAFGLAAVGCGASRGPLPASVARPLKTPDGSEVNIVCPPSMSELLKTADPTKVATAVEGFNINTPGPPEGLFPPGALTPAPNSLYSVLPTPTEIGHIDCCQEETNEELGAPFGGGGVYGFGASEVQFDQMGRQCGILADGAITFRIDLYVATAGAKEAYGREARSIYADQPPLAVDPMTGDEATLKRSPGGEYVLLFRRRNVVARVESGSQGGILLQALVQYAAQLDQNIEAAAQQGGQVEGRRSWRVSWREPSRRSDDSE